MPQHTVIALTAGHGVVPGIAEHAVDTFVAVHLILASATIQDVVTKTAMHFVIACAAPQTVIATFDRNKLGIAQQDGSFGIDLGKGFNRAGVHCTVI